MNNVQIVFPSEVATRRAIARGEWLIRVEAALLDPVTKSVLTDPRNLDAWWPIPDNAKVA